MRHRRTPIASALMLGLLLAARPAGAAECDNEETKDNPLFSRMPNYCLGETQEKEFDAFKIFDGKKIVEIEGRVHVNSYGVREEATPASGLQIRRNYEGALKKMGAAFVYSGAMPDTFDDPRAGADAVVGRVVKGGSEIWLEVVPYNDGANYYLTTVAVETMKQDVTAGKLLETLKAEGHVALYINFDTGKAVVRPESLPVIEQVAGMLKGNPEIKLGVEGHTDNVGSAAANKTLSESRARAVVAALVAKGIDAGRLAASGWGQEKPVADNGTEEGRAKNRRVELVKR